MASHIFFLKSFSLEVDISFMKILEHSQKSCLVFDLGIRVTVIHQKVDIDDRKENKFWVFKVFPYNRSWSGCHA